MLSIMEKFGKEMKFSFEIREPETKAELEQYYQLRWKILRKPWNQPKGSERDELDNSAMKIIAVENGKVVGCGRGHLNSKEQGQIRYMAVDKSFQRQGIGTELLKTLEIKLKNNGAKKIVLKAREKAVSLYEKQGYEIYKEGEILFGEIKHFWMRKRIK